MYDLIYGSDRKKVQDELSRRLGDGVRDGNVTRITDAHSASDLEMSLRGNGLFGDKSTIVFDGLITGENEDIATRFLSRLPLISKAREQFYVVEGTLDASTRKMLEKHARESVKFDVAKREERSTIFALANALRGGDKKALWIGYQRELQKGTAPEAIHGVLFWAAKEIMSSARNESERARPKNLVSHLAQLPHEARRRGFELEYALEHFALSGM